MTQEHFIPHHVNATTEDLAGNNGIGRYIFLPGSDGRAKEISQHFDNLVIKPHPRGHNLYLGSINHKNTIIDAAAISTGMGCPSMEIILHELFRLGAKRFLRVGTAGTLQPASIQNGVIINVQASVRDEQTTQDYVPITIPAVASFEYMLAISLTAKILGLDNLIHTGTVHCKSSFYAREFGAGPRAENNKAYIQLLAQCGVLATEMETAALFIQSQLYNYQLLREGREPRHRVLAGAILGIIAVSGENTPANETETTIDRLIKLSIETVKTLAVMESV